MSDALHMLAKFTGTDFLKRVVSILKHIRQREIGGANDQDDFPNTLLLTLSKIRKIYI